MNVSKRPPEIVRYFDYLETKYDEKFTVDRLTDSELVTMERLARSALKKDQALSEEERSSLVPLISLLEQHRKRREQGPVNTYLNLWV